MKKLSKSNTYFVLSAFFITLLIACNLLATKQISVFGWALTTGAFLFPFNFMLGDVITEVYGYKKMKQTIILGFLCQVLIMGVTALAIYLPYPAYYQNQQAFATIFGLVPRIVAGSLLAYLVGETVNAKIMDFMKQKWNKSPFWTRTIGSTVLGQIFDSAVFVVVAFLGVLPTQVVVQMILLQYVVKVVTEAVLGTPLAYLLKNYLEKGFKNE